MNPEVTKSILRDILTVLVRRFGLATVEGELRSIAGAPPKPPGAKATKPQGAPPQRASLSVAAMLEPLRESDHGKHQLLTSFYTRLKGRTVLIDSQDIRQFAQLIGLKGLYGKSRKDLIPKLMRFLITQPTEQIRTAIPRAATVSEQQRQQGYSLLTDKLLANEQTPQSEVKSDPDEEFE